MTGDEMWEADAALIAALAAAIAEQTPQWAGVEFAPLPDRGLAHLHVGLVATGVLARIPKQSQLQLGVLDNLEYQAACFARASTSGRAPRLHAVLRPRPGLPRGALLVDHIEGRATSLPADLPAIARSLARLHSLPLPASADRSPLQDAADPLANLRDEIAAHAAHLDAAELDPATRAVIDRERDALDELCTRPDRPAKHLISFDAHPGNFLIRSEGEAVLVDLEKCRYSYPALDLAHATLYTSTTWERGSSAVLDGAEVQAAYAAWSAEFQSAGGGVADTDWQVPLRRAMWLWSLTWCAKWRVLSGRRPDAAARGEDWASSLTADDLTAYVRDRVDHYLDPDTVRRIAAELDALEPETA